MAAHLGVAADRLVSVHQVHSPDVAIVEAPWPGDRPRADAMATRTPGLALGTRQGVVKRVNPELLAAKDDWDVIALKDGDSVVGAVELKIGSWMERIEAYRSAFDLRRLVLRRERREVSIIACNTSPKRLASPNPSGLTTNTAERPPRRPSLKSRADIHWHRQPHNSRHPRAAGRQRL